MCGINGFITKKKLEDVEKRIDNMNRSLYHRGPDAGGKVILNNGHVVLGQRRLAIIDIDNRSNQPYSSNSNKNIIVYNGEIYNYKNLKKNIEYDFKTNSDTEVLLAGLEQYGIDWIKQCNGMFAFGMYDCEKKEFFLCRDRMGIKPLYYYIDEDTFIFSSEIKGILNSGLVKAEINSSAIDEYLGYRYVREPYTFFKNIKQLPAGSYISVDDDLKYKINYYWTLPKEFNTELKYDENEIYEEFKQQIITSIKRRLISDVPLGTYLSGGIDSSLISAITALNSKNRINSYTIGFKDLNEFEYSDIVARRYNTKHTTINLDMENYFEYIPELISYKDAPLGVPNEIPLAIMSKRLKEDITVVLSGEGADELMGGYGRIYQSAFDFDNFDKDYRGDFYSYFTEKYEYVPREIRDRFLNVDKELRYEFDKKIREEFQNSNNSENIFRFFHKYHIKGLLQRVDTTTMYASVEARVPFLDHNLIEFTYKNIPYELKIKWKSDQLKDIARSRNSSEYSEEYDCPKYFLKKMALEYLPEEVVYRKKMGFPVPLNKYYDDLIHLAKINLSECDWIKKGMLEQLMEDCRVNSRSGQLLWMFINVEIFKKMYFDKEWRY